MAAMTGDLEHLQSPHVRLLIRHIMISLVKNCPPARRCAPPLAVSHCQREAFVSACNPLWSMRRLVCVTCNTVMGHAVAQKAVQATDA